MNSIKQWSSWITARFILLDYVRSGWIIGDVLFIWLLYALFFLEAGGDVTYFFGTATEGLGALTILNAVILTWRTMRSQSYLSLARLTQRGPYIRGLILAATLLRIPSFLLYLGLSLSYHHLVTKSNPNPYGIPDATIGNLLIGSTGLIIVLAVISVVTILLMPPIATRITHLSFFGWLAIVMATNTSDDSVRSTLSVSHLPLWPLANCTTIGISNQTLIEQLASITLTLSYLVLFTLIASRWFSKRDLIFES
jgi:hypothetical protein